MTLRKLRLALLIGLPLLAVLIVVAYMAALNLLKTQITAALGKTGEIKAIHVSLSKIEIEGLRIKASRAGWPGADELRAERVSVSPDLRSLLSDTIVIRAIDIDQAALTVLRSRDGMKILPALLDQGKPKPTEKSTGANTAPSGPKIRIGRIALRNSQVDFFDATVAAKALHIPLQNIELNIGNLLLPALNEKASLQLSARVANQGQLALNGSLVPANMDSDLQLSLAEVPLTLVEPYLFKGRAGQIQSGTLALDVRSNVAKAALKAPGHLTLNKLELAGLGGLAREAAAAYARKKGLDADTSRPVDLDFVLQGNLNDSRFSLNEAIYAQAGLAVIKLIGLGGGSGNAGDAASALIDKLDRKGELKKLDPDGEIGKTLKGLFN